MGGPVALSRRAFLQATGAAAVAATLAPFVRPLRAFAADGDTPTRVGMVVIDDCRYDDVQYLPAFRSLCERGLVFDGHRTDTPSCAESRASIFTGYQKYSHRVAIDSTATYYEACVLGYKGDIGWIGPWERVVSAPRSATDNPRATSGQLNNWIKESAPNARVGIIGKYQNHYARPAKVRGVDFRVLDENGIPRCARRVPPDVDYWAVKVGDDRSKPGKATGWDGGNQDAYHNWICRGSNPSSTTDADGTLSYSSYALKIRALSWLDGVATCVCEPHGMQVGDTFSVEGCKPLRWNTPAASHGIDGEEWVVETVVDANTFTFSLPTNPGAVKKFGTAHPSKWFSGNIFLNDALTFLSSCNDEDPLFLYFAPDICHQGESDKLENLRKYAGSVDPASFMLRDGVPGAYAPTISSADSRFKVARVQWAQRQEGLRALNDHLEAMMAYVDSRGWSDSFAWIITSDQGVHHGEYGIYVDSGSMYFAKQTAFEPSCRAPLCIAIPGVEARHISRPTHHFDLPFTVLDLFGFTDHPVHELRDGVSLLRLLDPDAYAQRAIVLNHLLPGASMYVGALVEADGFKFIEAQPAAMRPELRVAQLYDLANDPDETTNLAGLMPDRVEAMRARAKVLRKARGPSYRNNVA